MRRLSDAALDALLAQDAPLGDLTTTVLGIAPAPGRITFAARGDMVLAGVEEAARLLERVGAVARPLAASGDRVAAGTMFLEGKGPAEALHLAWKVSQTLVEYMSGIATRARRIVDAARAVNPAVVVACTRKNFPGTKEASVRAVLAGGASMHRLGLSETLLVFAEHRAFLPADRDWIASIKAHAPERKLVVEVSGVDEAVALVRAGAEVVQLEKLSPAEVRAVVEAVGGLTPPPVIAAAGGVNEDNAAAYAATGCAVLVTSAPYFGKPADVKVMLGPVEPCLLRHARPGT